MMIALLLATLFASYASNRSSGAPLVKPDGTVDTAACRALAKFDIVTLESTPWAADAKGNPQPAVPRLLRKLNPKIRLWLYVLVGDQWLPPGFAVPVADRSGFAMAFRAVDSTNGWLYGTDGKKWAANYGVNLGKRQTVDALAACYERFLGTGLYDAVFLDDASTSIAWTNEGAGGRHIDYRRAGFRSLAQMDSARAVNIATLILRIHALPGSYSVARNGTGPHSLEDIDFKEELFRLVPFDVALQWMASPGTHWLFTSCYTPSQVNMMASYMRMLAQYGNAIVSMGPGRDWPPVRVP